MGLWPLSRIAAKRPGIGGRTPPNKRFEADKTPFLKPLPGRAGEHREENPLGGGVGKSVTALITCRSIFQTAPAYAALFGK